MKRVKRWVATTVLAGSLATGVGVAVPALTASPAGAQQQGLVNVEISNVNVLNHSPITVTVPINAAANICGVAVPVLSQDLTSGPVTCNAGANQQFRVLGFA